MAAQVEMAAPASMAVLATTETPEAMTALAAALQFILFLPCCC